MSSRRHPMIVSVMVHLRAETTIATRVDTASNCGSLSMDGPVAGYVTLFADRPELVRLRDTLTAMVTELDTERAALAQSLRADGSAA